MAVQPYRRNDDDDGRRRDDLFQYLDRKLTKLLRHDADRRRSRMYVREDGFCPVLQVQEYLSRMVSSDVDFAMIQRLVRESTRDNGPRYELIYDGEYQHWIRARYGISMQRVHPGFVRSMLPPPPPPPGPPPRANLEHQFNAAVAVESPPGVFVVVSEDAPKVVVLLSSLFRSALQSGAFREP
eukprot:TRINITY_DN24913_c0_g1_i4.p1 TRINITY_DN24913_c0_g1~~TRINITY_DN24913_c0_g1_i4.p1  ORF type:complete len:183 (+),score=12.87 TRINITY_DN24913_c0_g1_i4:107-655(+)